jgi:hypothetical protein
MCGGVIFPFKREHRAMLEQFYSDQQIQEFEQTGAVRSVYWSKGAPVLPAVLEEAGPGAEPELFLWGNRDKDVKLPQTGWAKLESIEEGKWAYLRPSPVVIPVTHGVEKGKWFTIDRGIRGLLVARGGLQRVYMLTEEADPEFVSVTGHPRKPVLVEQNDFPWLPAAPNGTLYAPNG